MKKFIAFFCLLLSFQTNLFATCGSPAFLGTLPAAPASGQAVSVINEATFCSGGCARVNFNVTWNSSFDVTIETFHCPGMLAYICTSTDTTALGNLPGGIYTVHYIVYESGDCFSFTPSDSIVFNFTVSGGGCPPPVAAFNSNANQLTVSFTDASTATAPVSWSWDFGDGGNSSLQNPSHTYPASGTYLVCLSITDSCGTDSVCQNVSVSCPAPVADFTYNAVQLFVNFTNTSTGGSVFSWNFGDGNTSSLENPNHTYFSPGLYSVCLTVTDSCGSDTICDSVQVIMSNMIGAWQLIPFELFPNPGTDIFTIKGYMKGEGKLTFHNQLGEEVMTRIVSEYFTETIDVKSWAAGIYFVKCEGRERVDFFRVVVK